MSAAPPALDLLELPLEGATLVEASAGTGKTHTIATLFVRLLLEKGFGVNEILVVTYTRAATAELRLRIRRRLVEALQAFIAGPETSTDPVLRALAERAAQAGPDVFERGRGRLRDALRQFDEAAISTIHGYCQRVLGGYSFESGSAFDQQLLEDDRLLVREVVQDYWASQLGDASEAFVAQLRARNVTIDGLAQLVERALANPDIVLVPEPAAPPAPNPELDRAVERAAARVQELWHGHRAALLDCLTDGRFHASQFRPASIRGEWSAVLSAITQLTAAEHPSWLARLAKLEVKKGKTRPEHPFFDACAELHAAAEKLRAALDAELVAFRHGLLEYARRELARRKAETAEVGFEDLLLQLRAALRSERGEALTARLRKAHPAALIDEFQDTDPVQCEIFQRIYAQDRPEPGSLLWVGDPKQAIYAFRGADIFAYLDAASAAERVSLPVNYRSDPGLLTALNALWSRVERPFLWPQIGYHPVSAPETARDRLRGPLGERAPFEILFVPRTAFDADNGKAIAKSKLELKLPELVACEIVRALESGSSLATEAGEQAIAPRHMAVLCRTNRQAQLVQAELRKLRVPSVLDGDASVFDSEMADELARVMTAMAEPSNAGGVRAALATSMLGVSGEELRALEREERRWDDWLALFHELCELWQTRGFIRAVHALLERCGVAARLLVRDDGERRYTDLMHLIELLHVESLRSRSGPLTLLEWHRRMTQGDRERRGLAAADVQIRLESDAHAVTLTTIHKSKGLEYPLVYCPFLWDGGLLRGLDKLHPRFHDEAHAHRLTLELGSACAGPAPEHLARAKQEALSEELRLLYVALTRAKHRATVVWGAFASSEDSALGYVLHQLRSPLADDLATLTSERLKKSSDGEMQAELEALVAAASGKIELRTASFSPAAAWEKPVAEPPALAARVLVRSPIETTRTSSFSRLAVQQHLSLPASEGLDRDEGVPVEVPQPPALERPRVALADFVAGTSFGHLVHSIYEHSDFRVSEPAELLPAVQRALIEYGMPDANGETLAAALFDTLRAPLAVHGLELPSLSAVGPHARVNELEFVFPLPEPYAPPPGMLQQDLFAHTGAQHDFSAKRLAQLFDAHGASPTERAYAARLRTLDFGVVSGFLRGFMDLVVEHAGRYYLIDYKSNHLGDYVDDYAPPRLRAAMIGHHYVLQASIYSVALHRYLRLRLPGYDYERHFGGVYYLFVRGMSPSYPLGSGVHAERPSTRLVAAFDALLGGAA